MRDPATFDRDAYCSLPIEEKFKYFQMSLQSIRDTLKPEMPLEDISQPYLLGITRELQEYLKFFGPIVNEASPQMDAKDIVFLESIDKSISSVYKALKDATNWLRVATKTLSITDKKFDPDLDFKYYECLDRCCEALSTALQNI